MLLPKAAPSAQGAALLAVPASLLPQADAVANTPSLPEPFVRGPRRRRESVAYTPTVCLLAGRRAAVVAVGLEVPADTEMRPSHRPVIGPKAYLLLREAKGTISTVAEL